MNHPCIETDKKICGGFPVIKGTRTRVVSIAIEYEYINRTHGEIISARPTSSWDKYTTHILLLLRKPKRTGRKDRQGRAIHPRTFKDPRNGWKLTKRIPTKACAEKSGTEM
jgi:hypothetical protein